MNKYKPEELDKFFKQAKEFVADSQYKLRVIDLRQFIDQIYPREGEISKQDLSEIKKNFVGLNNRVSHIEECLGIDFKLDGSKQDRIAEQPVEYNFIKDDLIRDKIIAYYREMLRYRYATRNHKQCFGEFCRLAIIQVEYMLNYFFANKVGRQLLANDEYDRVHKEWEEKGEEEHEPTKEDYIIKYANIQIEEVSKINYSQKSRVFCNAYLAANSVKYIRNNQTRSISIWTSDMRNRKSHGSSNSIEPYEEDYLTDVEKTNLEKWEMEIVDYVKEYNDNHNVKIKFEKKRLIQDKEVWKTMPSDKNTIYNSFSQLQWVSEKPFEDVHEFLCIVAKTCAKELKRNE